MMPEFPIAKLAIRKSQDAFFQSAVKERLGPLFGNIPSRVLEEGNRLKQQYSADMVHQTGMTQIKSKFQLTIDQIKANPYVIYEKYFDNAQDFANQRVLMTMQGINEITELTGNVVNSNGGFTTEHFFQSLEKVQIDFDKAGNPMIPTMVGSPETVNKMMAVLKEGEHLPENKKRIDAIIGKKRKDWHDRESNRKLVD